MKVKSLEFFKVSERLPDGDYECLLLYKSEGLSSDQFVGVMPWSTKNGMWLDILASPEAGACWNPKAEDVQRYGMWAKWEEDTAP